MPPDTTVYIHGQTGPPPGTGNDYVDSLLQSGWSNTEPVNDKSESPPFDAPAFLLLFVAGIFMVFVSNGLVLLKDFIRKKKREAEIKRMIVEKHGFYHELLTDCNPYYRSLPDEMKQRFIERTLLFADSKEFRFHAIEEEDYIPVLISGAAVQLTFGLQNYLMDYFNVIHVMKREYLLHSDNEIYLGHVSKKGIHISWSHFMRGYYDYTDAVNVGLHEMAHALQFDAYLGTENKYDRDFKERLGNFAEEGRPVFRAMRTGMDTLFHEYSTTNFDEFWAVSVENFFENTVLFKERLPVLYQELCELLNQDPLTEYKIIDPDLA